MVAQRQEPIVDETVRKARELKRRKRVVQGWAFRETDAKVIRSIQAYLDGGPAPIGYEQIDRAVRGR
jgi:hypothetical protein